MKPFQHPASSRQQRGAALVIGLILLAVLTLLAVSGMNTASTELIMAGNEQFQQRAFQASQTGIEQALGALGTTAGPATTPNASVTTPAIPIPDSGADQYVVTSRYMGEGSIVPNYSTDEYAIFQFEVQSTGRSMRNAQGRAVQGAFTIQSKSVFDFDDIPE